MTLWTTTEIKELHELADEGMPAAEIAVVLDRSRQSVYGKINQSNKAQLFRQFDTYAILQELRKRRKDSRCSQDAVAVHLGISYTVLGKFERGEDFPRLDKLEKWCEFLGMKLILTER